MTQDQINSSAYMQAVKQAGREAANSDKMTHYAVQEAADKYGVTYNQVRFAMFDIINNKKTK
jgi:predicted nuclease of restriction endonuclease-like RecB superfamily